jgi:hypothetical protein
MTSKSPFLVFQNLLTTEECDKIAKQVRVEPLVDDEGNLQSTERYHTEVEKTVFERFQPLIKEIEVHYHDFKYRGTEHLVFQQFPVSNGNPAEEPHCENAVYKRKRWIRTKDRDLTGILWLKDYQETPPFNIETQVLGGKLEFPVYNFGFQPQKGTLVVYPACERFISLTSPVLVGELQCIRFYICGEGIWLYNPANFPGDFRTWFNDIV